MANIAYLGLTIHGELIINDLESLGITDHEYFIKVIERLKKYILVKDDKWLWTSKLLNSTPEIYLPNTKKNAR